jgi:hypothetical protein
MRRVANAVTREQPTNPGASATGRSAQWRYKQYLTRLVEFLESEPSFPGETDVGISSFLGSLVVPIGLVLVIAIQHQVPPLRFHLRSAKAALSETRHNHGFVIRGGPEPTSMLAE